MSQGMLQPENFLRTAESHSDQMGWMRTLVMVEGIRTMPVAAVAAVEVAPAAATAPATAPHPS